jgi:hypothetical protein
MRPWPGELRRDVGLWALQTWLLAVTGAQQSSWNMRQLNHPLYSTSTPQTCPAALCALACQAWPPSHKLANSQIFKAAGLGYLSAAAPASSLPRCCPAAFLRWYCFCCPPGLYCRASRSPPPRLCSPAAAEPVSSETLCAGQPGPSCAGPKPPGACPDAPPTPALPNARPALLPSLLPLPATEAAASPPPVLPATEPNPGGGCGGACLVAAPRAARELGCATLGARMCSADAACCASAPSCWCTSTCSPGVLAMLLLCSSHCTCCPLPLLLLPPASPAAASCTCCSAICCASDAVGAGSSFVGSSCMGEVSGRSNGCWGGLLLLLLGLGLDVAGALAAGTAGGSGRPSCSRGPPAWRFSQGRPCSMSAYAESARVRVH